MHTWFTYLAEDNLHVPRILTLLQAQIQNISIVIDDPMSNVSWIAMQPFPDYPGKVCTFYTITQKVAKSFFEIINN